MSGKKKMRYFPSSFTTKNLSKNRWIKFFRGSEDFLTLARSSAPSNDAIRFSASIPASRSAEIAFSLLRLKKQIGKDLGPALKDQIEALPDIFVLVGHFQAQIADQASFAAVVSFKSCDQGFEVFPDTLQGRQ